VASGIPEEGAGWDKVVPRGKEVESLRLRVKAEGERQVREHGRYARLFQVGTGEANTEKNNTVIIGEA
jgi:hypothetical protein